MKTVIQTEQAPKAIGTYSQAVSVTSGKNTQTVYLSGQIPLDPVTHRLVEGIEEQIHQVFRYLHAVALAAGGSLNDVVKLNIYLMDLGCFATLNEIMAEYFIAPYPARAAIQVSKLPKDAQVEMDAIMVIDNI